MDKPRPYVMAAFICEKVLREQDDVLTAVRIVDKITMRLPSEGLPEGIKPAVPLTGLIGIKSGPLTGDFTLHVGVTTPTGEKKSERMSFPVTLSGGEQGQNFILNIGLGVDVEGLYWFDVSLDDDLLTRIPLIVTSEQAQPSPN